MRVGIGYDVHRLGEGETFVLGGVQIPYEKGLIGHSDADVLTHAVMDAILGALGKKDIGCHFPDTDPQYRGIVSLHLLEQVTRIMDAAGYEIGNLDTVILAQAPKLAPYMEQMAEKLAEVLHCSLEQINIKATTTEKLGYIGRGEGIAVEAIVLLQKRKKRDEDGEYQCS